MSDEIVDGHARSMGSRKQKMKYHSFILIALFHNIVKCAGLLVSNTRHSVSISTWRSKGGCERLHKYCDIFSMRPSSQALNLFPVGDISISERICRQRRYMFSCRSFLQAKNTASSDNESGSYDVDVDVDVDVQVQNQTQNPSIPIHEHDNEILESPWKAGNVQKDVELLRSAIIISKGPDKALESNRLRLLDTFARGRREVVPDTLRFIIAPILAGIFLGLSLSSSSLLGTFSSPLSLKNKGVIWICRCMDMHFWFITVLSNIALLPIILNMNIKLDKKITTTPNRIKQSESQTMSWMNPRKEFIDPPRFLSEMWISSIFGPCCFYAVVLGMFFKTNRNKNRNIAAMGAIPQHYGYGYGMSNADLVYAAIQLFTRLAVAMSIHQYPKVMYELQKKDQPRPLSKATSTFQRLSAAMMTGLPFGFACDFAKLFSIFATRYNNSFPLVSLPLPRWFYLSAIISITGPLMHLIAFKRIFQIQYVSNISLSQKYSTVDFALSNPSLRSKLLKWRWSLKWRKPENVTKTLRKWSYLFIAGYASREDRRNNKLYASLADWRESALDKPFWDREKEKDLESSSSSSNSNIDKVEWKSELLRLEAERHEKNPIEPIVDRATWVSNAMNAMENVHQQNYEQKNFNDYLGVALQQTLGIGLSFDYDHETELKPGESPSVHRLRARAAKSAIAHIRQLYNPTLAQKKLESIHDPDERQKASDALRQSVKEETELLSQSLMELIPSNADAPEGTEGLEMQLLAESDIPGRVQPGAGLVAEIGETPDLMEDMMRKEFGNDYVDDPWVQQGLRKEEISLEDLEKMKKIVKKDVYEKSDKDDVISEDQDGENDSIRTYQNSNVRGLNQPGYSGNDEEYFLV